MTDETTYVKFGQQTYSTQTIVETVSMRDQFAMAALTAVMDKVGGFRPMVHAKDAYHMADAMLEARKEKKND